MANPARVEALIKQLETDPTLREQLQAAASPAEMRTTIDQHGFTDLTIDDVKAYQASHQSVLSDEQLEQVAGGFDEDSYFIGMGAGLGSVAVGGAIGAAAAAG